MFVATFPFGYGGRVLHRGQVLDELQGLPNDTLLLNLNRFRKLSPGEIKHVVKCDNCGNKYVDVRALHNHRKKKICGVHDSRVLDRDRVKDGEVISSLPDRLKDQITDLR